MWGHAPKRSFLDPQAIARLTAVPVVARRPMVGSVSGMHASPHRGASVEFAEYRRYVPGDDPRRLDWRAYGRTDRYYVKEFEADTNLRLCLVLDTSGSMGYGSTGLSKLDFALRIAAALAWLAIQQGDAVGLTCIDHRIVHHIPPRRTPTHLRSLLDTLENLAPNGDTGLTERLHEFAETTPQRAFVIILSDLFIPPEELQAALDHLRFRRHDVALFQLLDPHEITFDFRRPTRFVDLENGSPLLTDPQEIADRYQQAFAQHQQSIQRLALQAGIELQTVRIDAGYEDCLLQFLAGRHRSRGLR